MWKCIRCEKENQDSEEMCAACGHERAMDYTGHRTLAKISSSVTDNWKSSQSDPEYFKEQALKHLKEAAGLLEKSGFRGAAAKINEVITEVEQYSPRQKLQMDFTMILRMYLKKTQALQTEKKTEFQNRKQQQRTIRVLNQEELDNRKNRRIYTGNSIKEICENFLSYEDNEWINGGYFKNVKIEFSEESFLFFGDSEKSGFAITEKGIYSKDTVGTADFLSWENFGEARVMYPGNGVLKIKGNKIASIAYFNWDRESFLQIEMLFIAIHAYLNRNTPYIEQDTDIVKNKTPNIRIVENHHPTQQDTDIVKNKTPNIRIVENHHSTQQDTDIVKNKTPNIRIVENHHPTQQDTDIVKNKTPNIRIVENHHPTQQDTNPFRIGGQNVLGKDINPVDQEKIEIQKQQNSNAFRIGGQNVLGKDINPADQEKTDTQEPSAVIYARDILLNDGKVYDGSGIAEICLKFLSYEENKGIDTGRKDNIINTLKIPSGDTIYLVHDDSWFKRGKNGFAITDRGVYVKDIGEAADFVPWEEFRKCKNIESKSCYVTSDGRKIAYITGGDRLRSQLERLFITIYKLLNEKEN